MVFKERRKPSGKVMMSEKEWRRIDALNIDSVLDKFFKTPGEKSYPRDWMFDKHLTKRV